MNIKFRPKMTFSITNIAAMQYKPILGKRIQEGFPEMADDYRGGMTMTQIASKYKLSRRYKICKRTARSVVSLALKGFVGSEITEAYPGLITDQDELKRLAAEHFANARKEARDIKVVSRRIKTIQKKNGQRLAISQGKTIITKKEIELVLTLAQIPKYQAKIGINAKLIAVQVNERIHGGKDVRSNRQVTKIYMKFRPRITAIAS